MHSSDHHATAPHATLDREALTALPLIPVQAQPVFPGAHVALNASEPVDMEVIEDASRQRKLIAVVLALPDEAWQERGPWFEPIVTVARVDPQIEHTEGGLEFSCLGLARVRALREYEIGLPYSVLDAEALPPSLADHSLTLRRWHTTLRGMLPTLSRLDPARARDLRRALEHHLSCDPLADALGANLLHGDPQAQRAVYLERDPARRLERAGQHTLARLMRLHAQAGAQAS